MSSTVMLTLESGQIVDDNPMKSLRITLNRKLKARCPHENCNVDGNSAIAKELKEMVDEIPVEYYLQFVEKSIRANKEYREHPEVEKTDSYTIVTY